MFHCEWCGKAEQEMPVWPAETIRGWLTDPFPKIEPRFFACSESCKSQTETYYANYRRDVRKWAGGLALIFGVAFGVSIPFGFSVSRWTLPTAVAIGGIWMIRRPYTNSFRRDREGCLKISLRRSLRDGRLMGIGFVVVAVILAAINTQLPADIFAP